MEGRPYTLEAAESSDVRGTVCSARVAVTGLFWLPVPYCNDSYKGSPVPIDFREVDYDV